MTSATSYDGIWLIALFFTLNPIFELQEFSFYNIVCSLTDRLKVASENGYISKSRHPPALERILLRSVLSLFLLSNLIMVYIFFRPAKLLKIVSQILISISALGNTISFYLYQNDFKNHPVFQKLKRLALTLAIFKEDESQGGSALDFDVPSESLTTVANFCQFIFSDDNHFKNRIDLYSPSETTNHVDNLHLTKNFVILTRKSPFKFWSCIEFVPIVSSQELPTQAICLDAVFRQTINENYDLHRNRNNHHSSCKQFLKLKFSWLGDAKNFFELQVSEEKFSNELKPNLEVRNINVIILNRLNLDLSVFKQFLVAWRDSIESDGVSQESSSDFDRTCPICTEQNANIKSKRCSCRSVFCNGCLANWFITNINGNVKPEDWLLQKGNCPICRKSYGVGDLRKI